MNKSISSLISLIEKKAKTDPLTRRAWSTAMISNQFAKTITILRHRQQLSEEELADKVGCSVDIISNIENPTSDNIPRLENMVAVAQALGHNLSINTHHFDPSAENNQIAPSVQVMVNDDLRVLGEQYLLSPETNNSIAIVSVDSKGHVRLPVTIGIELDRDAFFHSIPMRVKADES